MKKLLIVIHTIVLLCTYAPVINIWITPEDIPYWNTFSLAFPVLIIVNVLMILMWFLLKWRIGILFFMVSLPLIIILKPWFPLLNSAGEESSDFSLMTYNVRYFYDDYDSIKALLVKKAPTVVFFQEMGADPESIVKAMDSQTPYFFENYNSLGIVSRFPIIESNQIRYQNYPLCAVYGDIAMPKDTIRFINIYLESLHLDQENIKNTMTNTKDVKNKSKMLIAKVAKAAKIHQEQIKLIQTVVKQSPHPVIIGGDLNAVPTTFEYYQFSQGLKDAFVEAGHQPGHTFRSLKVPLKLDYIFTSEQIETSSYEILKVKYSDHYPTWVTFKWPKP